jgi:hypothetical protein
VFRSWVVEIFAFWAIYLDGTGPRNIRLPHWQTRLATTGHTRAPSKVTVLELVQLQKHSYEGLMRPSTVIDAGQLMAIIGVENSAR